MVDDVAVSTSSNWNYALVSKQWPEVFERSLVLSWKALEELAVVRLDITVVLSGETVLSPSRWGPIRVSKQWSELFVSGRVLSCETLTGLAITDWDIVSIVGVCKDSHLGICGEPLGPIILVSYKN